MHKKKILQIAVGGVGVLAVVIIGFIFSNSITIGQRVKSIKLNDENINTLKSGEICHFVKEEKQSIPYRWRHYISDENLMDVYSDEHKDDSGLNPAPGGDKGWRWLYFKALAPGECVITLQYEDIRDGKCWMEYRYNIVITDE